MSYIGRAGLANPVYELERELWAIGSSSTEATPTSWPAAPGLPREMAAPRRILIVEDEPIIAMTLEALVEDLGREPCGVAATGVEAVELAKSLRPDVMLMDVSLIGDMDGIEAARLAREATGVRVVFVTAYGSGEIMDRIRAIHPGAPIVPKPVDPSSLRRAIEEAEAL